MGLLDIFKGKMRNNKQKNTNETSNNFEIQKDGYIELINICVDEQKKDELIDFVKKMKDYNGDEDYFTTLNFVMSYLDDNNIHFIMALDWKQEIRDLNWRISSALMNNFNVEIDLPNPEIYGKNKSVSFDNVFSDYDNSIKEKGYLISFIDTKSDEYVIVVHKIEDKEKVKNAIKKIGYNTLYSNIINKK